MTGAAPSFEDWREYCFTQGYADFGATSNDEAFERQGRFVDLSAEQAAEYLIRLFDDAVALERYRVDQLADGTWFVFGVASELFGVALGAPPEMQVELYRAAAGMYVNCYDQRCNRGPSDLLDGAVYMIWDMNYIEVPAIFPESYPHLANPAFELLERVLRECTAPACIESALHGLGHATAGSGRQRAEAIIDKFVQQRSARFDAKVVGYAAQARSGMIQ